MALDEILRFIARIMTFEVSLGDSKVSVSALLFVSLLFIGFIVLSRVVRTFLKRTLIPRLRLDAAGEFTLLKVTHYLIIAFGVLVCLSTLGVNITSLAFVAGLLSVGIGFGLQNIVQNFVAGLILLFEQPIKVGDWVKVGDQEGEVKEINLRSTGIETNESIYIIIPNQDLISNPVINGSKGDPWVWISTDVGVAYETDMRLVHRLLLESAQEHPDVLKDPAPGVRMINFGESSVDFRIITCVLHPRTKNRIKAEILWSVWWKFKDAGIEIPYPQRDFHIKSVEGSALPVRMVK